MQWQPDGLTIRTLSRSNNDNNDNDNNDNNDININNSTNELLMVRQMVPRIRIPRSTSHMFCPKVANKIPKYNDS